MTAMHAAECLAALGILALIIGVVWNTEVTRAEAAWVGNDSDGTGAWAYSTPAPSPPGAQILFTLAVLFTLPLICRLLLLAVL